MFIIVMLKEGIMARTRILLVTLLVFSCAIPLRVAATAAPLVGGEPFPVPLPVGREMTDDELLDVEGELVWFVGLIIVAVAAGVGAGGATAVHENWFDEDYGIDGDDWRNIGLAAGGTCAGVMTGGVASHFVGPI